MVQLIVFIIVFLVVFAAAFSIFFSLKDSSRLIGVFFISILSTISVTNLIPTIAKWLPSLTLTRLLSALTVLLILCCILRSIKIVSEGNEALVERLGRYHRTIRSGLNFIYPFLERIVVEDTRREQQLEIESERPITRDNIKIKVYAGVFWVISDLKKAYYNVEDVEAFIQDLVISSLCTLISELDFEQTNTSRTDANRGLLQQLASDINNAPLHQLKEAVKDYGIEVKSIEILGYSPPPQILDARENEKAAESEKQAQISLAEGRKQAAILEAESEKQAQISLAEGRKQAAILEAEGTVRSLEIILETLHALPGQVTSPAMLNYLLVRANISANNKLAESPNSKIIFIDSKAQIENLSELITFHANQSNDSDFGSNPPLVS